jgi:chaperonin GroEL
VQYQKVKSVAKHVEVKGSALTKRILSTMKTISDLVGATLGPGGSPVLIERQELNMPPMVTKDGVTVFRSIGFDGSIEQILMEAARDASVRTANEAGDGTTTATVLAEAIVRKTVEYCASNPRVSPQKVVRRLMAVFRDYVEPLVRKLSLTTDMSTEEGRNYLRAVAKVSANGDEELADAVMECFDLVGDGGNVTILEVSGPSHYEVERIEGFPIGIGYDDSCLRYWPMFITDQGYQKVVLGGDVDTVNRPYFVLYHGKVNDIQTCVLFMEKIGATMDALKNGVIEPKDVRKNIVFVATGFSDQVLATLASNFQNQHSINVVPLLVPPSPIHNGQLAFLEDLSAITGAVIFNPVNKPLDTGELSDLGPGVESFEMNRFRSTIIGHTSEDAIIERVSQLELQLQEGSILENTLIYERIGKLTGGIAKLRVVGSSNGELREKRDRAEDAVCAVRGAVKHGVLPGGGWTLIKLVEELEKLSDPIIDGVLRPALMEPVFRLLKNCGMDDDEGYLIIKQVVDAIKYDYCSGPPVVYDALEQKFVDAYKGGVLDSTPAVLEAIRNSLSIAGLLGTLGGAVVFKRDEELERTEARETAEFERNSSYNPADERA